MARRCGCGRRGDQGAGCAAQQEVETIVRVEEELPMRRHVNSVNAGTGCGSIEWQLCRIRQALDEQSRMIEELRQEMRR